jgi:glycosyltransferase involved in cell wall biosynthesis
VVSVDTTVSVIIPCYNNAPFLSKTLAGFVGQKTNPFRKWEIILVDNNSSDCAIAETQLQYRDKLPVSLIQQPQLKHSFSLCRARNLGLRLAHGEWMVVLDADTIPNPLYLERLAELIGDTEQSFIATAERVFISTRDVAADHIMTNPDILKELPTVLSKSNYALPRDRRLPVMQTLPDIEHPWDYMHGCNVVFRREDALRIGGYDEAYDGRWGFEDIDFAYRLITDGGVVPRYGEGLHVYHQEDGDEMAYRDRTDKGSNPNWARVCTLIPGYREYKAAKYHALSSDIKV